MKKIKEQKTIIKQVSRKLEELRDFQKQANSVSSWINYIRDALGMSLSQLASRVGVAQSSLSGSIKLEQEGRITVHKLREIADAMECDLVYAFVPRKSIEEILHEQSLKKTKQLMKETENHMALEDQRVTISEKERLNDLVEERMYSKYLWDK
jgi:predicted DNA-binding mobile mystery protein A